MKKYAAAWSVTVQCVACKAIREWDESEKTLMSGFIMPICEKCGMPMIPKTGRTK